MKPSRQARATLLVLMLANTLNFFDRQVIAALAPLLQAHWRLSDVQVGLLGTAFELAFALAPLPIGLLADRWLRRRVVALALALWSGAMALAGVAPSYLVLLLGRAGLGLGEAGYSPAALAWLSDVYPPGQRSRVTGVHDLGIMLGSAGGYALGGVLAKLLGWRPVLYLAALPGLLLAAAVWLMPEPQRGQSDYQATGTAPLLPLAGRRDLARALRAPTLLVVCAAGALISFATNALSYWLPTFAVRLHGWGEDTAGLLIGGVALAAGAAGVLAGGFLADYLVRRTPAGRLWTVGISFLVGVPLATAAIWTADRVLFVLLAGLAFCLFTFYFPCMAPLVHQVIRPELRATAFALYMAVIHLVGDATAPAVVGWVSDQTGDLRLGVSVAALAALLGGLIALWGTRFVGRDVRSLAAGQG